MRLWTAMLGAWLAAGPGTANADGKASADRLVREKPRASLPMSHAWPATQPMHSAAAEDQAPAPRAPGD
jgi:hypothetical protein